MTAHVSSGISKRGGRTSICSAGAAGALQCQTGHEHPEERPGPPGGHEPSAQRRPARLEDAQRNLKTGSGDRTSRRLLRRHGATARRPAVRNSTIAKDSSGRCRNMTIWRVCCLRRLSAEGSRESADPAQMPLCLASSLGYLMRPLLGDEVQRMTGRPIRREVGVDYGA